MKNTIGILLLASFLSCTNNKAFEILGQERKKVATLQIGMSKHDVMTVMTMDDIKFPNGYISPRPYKSEMYKHNENVYEILYYHTDFIKADMAVIGGELTPIVFKNNKLDGWGWSYWDDVTKKIELKVKNEY